MIISPAIIAKAKKRAQDYTDRNKIASFILTNITHMRIGGYNAKNKSVKLNNYFEYPREQSLKGLWRWWLRALLSGTALSDDQIKRNVDELLGSNDIPAKYRIRLLVSKGIDPPVSIIDQQGLNDLANPNLKRRSERTYLFNRLSLPSRLELSVMDRNLSRLEEYDELLSVYHPDKLNLLMEIYSDKSKTEFDVLVIYSLALAITFSGMGSITRRGFGKFVFQEIIKSPDEISNAIESIREDSKTALKLETGLKKIIENAAMSAQRIFGTKKEIGLPMHPTLDSKGNYFKLKVLDLKNASDSKSALHKIGKATLKSEWKKLKFGNTAKSGRHMHTWVLGLPRYQGGSGYVSDIQGQQVRRASAIFITPYLSLEKKWYVVVLGFKSLDWPNIIHTPGSRSRSGPLTISLNNDEFSSYFDCAFNIVVEYLQEDQGSKV